VTTPVARAPQPPRLPEGASPQPPRWPDLLLAVAVAAQLAPVLLLGQVVTVDGPAHLLGATVLAEYADPGHPIYSRLYRLDFFPSPNLLTGAVLAMLLWMLPAAAAEKLVAAAVLVLVPLALRYAARGVRPDAGWLALVAPPLAAGYLFFYGFTNFVAGLGLALLAVGHALRQQHRWRPGATVVQAGLLVLTYLAHLAPFAVALLTVGAVASSRRQLRAVALAAVPALLLTAAYLARPGQPGPPAWKPPLDLLAGLVTLALPVVTFDRLEVLPALLLSATLGTLGVLAVRRHGRASLRGTSGALAAVTAVSAVLVVSAPATLGVQFGFLNERLSYAPPLLFALWLAAHPPGQRARGIASVALLAVSVGLVAIRLPALTYYDRLLGEFSTAAAAVPPGATVLPVRLHAFTPPGGAVRIPTWDPLRHASSGIAARRRGVDVGHYEGQLAYFPTQFRSGLNTRRVLDPTLAGLERVPPIIDLGAAADATVPVDFVLLVGRRAAGPPDPGTARLLAALELDYRRVATTSPTGLVEVWARR